MAMVRRRGLVILLVERILNVSAQRILRNILIRLGLSMSGLQSSALKFQPPGQRLKFHSDGLQTGQRASCFSR
jgi:hypothetical protein